MLDGVHPRSKSMTDAKLLDYRRIEAKVARQSVKIEAALLGDLTWELARGFGYDLEGRAEAPVKERSEIAPGGRHHLMDEQRRLRQAFRERLINQQEIK
jgi:hypothetical protein